MARSIRKNITKKIRKTKEKNELMEWNGKIRKY
jgi:hypothetical protein